jgi:hypothetical protein
LDHGCLLFTTRLNSIFHKKWPLPLFIVVYRCLLLLKDGFNLSQRVVKGEIRNKNFEFSDFLSNNVAESLVHRKNVGMTIYALKELGDKINLKAVLFDQVKNVMESGLDMMEVVIGVGKCSTSRDMDAMKRQRSKWFPLCLALLGTRIVGM